MGYKCGICPTAVKGKLKKYTIYRFNMDGNLERKRGQIEREIPVCDRCNRALQAGASVEELMRTFREGKVHEMPQLIAPCGAPEIKCEPVVFTESTLSVEDAFGEQPKAKNGRTYPAKKGKARK